MARALTIIIVLLMLTMALPLTAGTQPYQDPNADRQMKTACGIGMNTYLRQGQPVVLTLTLENRSFEEVVLDLGHDRQGAFQFRLKEREGDWIDLPPKKVREGISLVAKISLPAQGSYSQQFILDEWYKFNQLGKYTVSVTLPNSLCQRSELDFEILPFDAELLSEFCDRQVELIRKNTNDYGKAADAAKVLARVDYSLAVPFLVKALEANQMVDSILIPALERIGDKEAVDFLISFLEKNVSSSAKYELVRPALVRLEKRSTPEEIVKIRIALARFPAP